MIACFKIYQRDARQVAGLATLAIIYLIVGSALLTTLLSGWSGAWASSFSAVAALAGFTLLQAILSLILSLGLAIPFALALDSKPDFFVRRFIVSLFTIPLSLPVIVAIIALLALLGRNGLLYQFANFLGYDWRPNIYGLPGILIAHVFFNMPLAVRIVLQSFETIAQEQWKLTESLSLSTWYRFRLVQWPVLKAALPGLCGLILLLCVSSYTIILVLGGGPQTTTLQVAIYQALSFDFDLERAAVLTLAQIAITLTLLIGLTVEARTWSKNSRGDTRRYHTVARGGQLLSSVIIILGTSMVALPIAAIVWTGITSDHLKLLSDTLVWQALLTSSLIALSSSALAIVSAWSLSAALYSLQRSGATRQARLVQLVPLLTLGLPPLVLGVGWFLLMIKAGIPLNIAPLLIVLANALMALPFAMQIIQHKLHETYSRSDRLSASLSIRGFDRFWQIDWPLMKKTVITAALIAFALSIGDLGVVTLFGSDQILTLPALIFQKMGSYRTNDADGLALYLALLTGGITFLATKVQRT